ncbi:MAG: hypothetical protein E5X67_21410 [Mesorhizobium sp.]|uniref:hypothetical protein n=1 Tax=Mesorhizobium sp. TaxID=1871066 RepID=UPI001214CF79|nr:hypothetical protein [Mesorhizobium sp.]TIP26223.1 MAG: hypothetical protein E5X67_21410 [Mesorhizobium sp.]
MTITIHVAGAQPEDIVRGLLAAQSVFDRAGVTPDLAATARFIVEGWDIRGFPNPAPEAELAICNVWDEADQAAVEACCVGWPADRIPDTADLELVREPQRFRLTSEEERSEWQFQTAEAGILEEMCGEGYFNEGRPEDEVVFLLDYWDFERLTEEQRRLYDERIYPLMRIWFFEHERFEEEYTRLRAEWARGLPPDNRQLSLFAA